MSGHTGQAAFTTFFRALCASHKRVTLEGRQEQERRVQPRRDAAQRAPVRGSVWHACDAVLTFGPQVATAAAAPTGSGHTTVCPPGMFREARGSGNFLDDPAFAGDGRTQQLDALANTMATAAAAHHKKHFFSVVAKAIR